MNGAITVAPGRTRVQRLYLMEGRRDAQRNIIFDMFFAGLGSDVRAILRVERPRHVRPVARRQVARARRRRAARRSSRAVARVARAPDDPAPAADALASVAWGAR